MSEALSSNFIERQSYICAREKAREWTVVQAASVILRVGAVVALILGGMGAAHHFSGLSGLSSALIFGGGMLGFFAGHRLSGHSELKRMAWQSRAKSLLVLMDETMTHTPPSKLEKIANRLSNLIYGIFQRKILSCNNSGKLEDLSRYDAPVDSRFAVEVAKKHGIVIHSDVDLTPFGRGVCRGASLYFAAEYFRNGGDIHAVDRLFKGGAPYEAVLIQGQSNNIWFGVFMKCTDIPAQNTQEWMDTRQEQALCELAGLDCIKFENNLTKEKATASLLQKGEGVYLLAHSNHATLLIKKGPETYFYDPNKGTYTIVDLAKDLNEELPDKGNISISALHPHDTGDAGVDATL